MLAFLLSWHPTRRCCTWLAILPYGSFLPSLPRLATGSPQTSRALPKEAPAQSPIVAQQLLLQQIVSDTVGSSKEMEKTGLTW
jgi:hypothetical protein